MKATTIMRVIVFVFSLVAVSHCQCIFCTLEYEPVCGTNGITYNNKCGLNCDGAELAYTGKCKKACPCHKVYKPVCGKDNITYGNRCMMDCAGVDLFREGVCTAYRGKRSLRVKRQSCPCPLNYDPVCGVNGVTYPNFCALRCARGVEFFEEGACTVAPRIQRVKRQACGCSNHYDPVCGRDGVTYRNTCFMACSGAWRLHRGPCRD